MTIADVVPNACFCSENPQVMAAPPVVWFLVALLYLSMALGTVIGLFALLFRFNRIFQMVCYVSSGSALALAAVWIVAHNWYWIPLASRTYSVTVQDARPSLEMWSVFAPGAQLATAGLLVACVSLFVRIKRRRNLLLASALTLIFVGQLHLHFITWDELRDFGAPVPYSLPYLVCAVEMEILALRQRHEHKKKRAAKRSSRSL